MMPMLPDILQPVSSEARPRSVAMSTPLGTLANPQLQPDTALQAGGASGENPPHFKALVEGFAQVDKKSQPTATAQTASIIPRAEADPQAAQLPILTVQMDRQSARSPRDLAADPGALLPDDGKRVQALRVTARALDHPNETSVAPQMRAIAGQPAKPEEVEGVPAPAQLATQSSTSAPPLVSIEPVQALDKVTNDAPPFFTNGSQIAIASALSTERAGLAGDKALTQRQASASPVASAASDDLAHTTAKASAPARPLPDQAPDFPTDRMLRADPGPAQRVVGERKADAPPIAPRKFGAAPPQSVRAQEDAEPPSVVRPAHSAALPAMVSSPAGDSHFTAPEPSGASESRAEPLLALNTAPTQQASPLHATPSAQLPATTMPRDPQSQARKVPVQMPNVPQTPDIEAAPKLSTEPISVPSKSVDLETQSPTRSEMSRAADNEALSQALPKSTASQFTAASNALASNPLQTPTQSAPAPTVAPTTSAVDGMETAIERLIETRETARAQRPELTVRNSEFGAVHVRLEAAGGDLRATLANRDPGFVPAVQSALAERAVAPTSEAAMTGQRAPDQQTGSSNSGQNNSQTGGQSHFEQRYGSSTGSEQGSSKPYWGQNGVEDSDSARSGLIAEDQNPQNDQSAGGLFA